MTPVPVPAPAGSSLRAEVLARGLHRVRLVLNAIVCLLVLAMVLIYVALLLGMPDIPLGPDETAMFGLLGTIAVVSFIAIIYGAPVILAVNVLDWGVTLYVRRAARRGLREESPVVKESEA
ncbi:hypothetical protein BN1051_00144 [Arthrobacter saudimassiliensis]|uniref:Uncharacterized protein n=1 Tax=Arthrobacter saudimassiliensis TaxID=1461584 RepID=A0A078MN10_9MICC|nr:hypothetical protein BN1051_00144 [Arthrobacter saudimassiliensis]